MGFKYRGFIDPFDGGPHLDAPTDGVDLVKSTKAVKLGQPMPAAKASKLYKHGIVSVLSPEGEFRALETRFAIEKNTVRLAEAEFEARRKRRCGCRVHACRPARCAARGRCGSGFQEICKAQAIPPSQASPPSEQRWRQRVSTLLFQPARRPDRGPLRCSGCRYRV